MILLIEDEAAKAAQFINLANNSVILTRTIYDYQQQTFIHFYSLNWLYIP